MDLLKTQYVFNCNKADVIKQGVLTPCRKKIGYYISCGIIIMFI